MINQDTQYETGLRLWVEWTAMWNGDPGRARDIVADRFALHLTAPTQVDETTVVTPSDVEAWVTRHCSRFTSLHFHAGCGPFVDVRAGVVAGPWWADASLDGTPRVVCGMDTIAFRDGKITEYWTLSKEADSIGRWVSKIY